MGTSAKGKSRHTDGQVWGSPFFLNRVAFDVSIVDPNAVSHSGAGACGESFLNPNAGTRSAEKTKTDKFKFLCQQLGIDFVPIIFTASGGMGPHWSRVEAEDEAMNIGPWVARKRKAFWQARFAVAIANCNARMITRSQHITD